MRVFRQAGARSVAFPGITLVLVTVVIRAVVPVHPADGVGVFAVIAGMLVVFAVAFWARQLDARRAAATERLGWPEVSLRALLDTPGGTPGLSESAAAEIRELEEVAAADPVRYVEGCLAGGG
jgi:hypothetical protein